jgi:hypothetical protein
LNDIQGLHAAKVDLREVGRVVDDAVAKMAFLCSVIIVNTAVLHISYTNRVESSCSPLALHLRHAVLIAAQMSDMQGLRTAKINPCEVDRVVDDAYVKMTVVHF